MPYLMLNFEVSKPGIGGGIGADHIAMRMIDAEHGKVVEISGEITNVQHEERAPEWGEMHAASQVLGKGVGETVLKSEYDRIITELNSYRQKVLASQAIIDAKEHRINDQEKELKLLRGKTLSDDDAALVGEALDDFITQLAFNGPYESYTAAKKLFRRMTGMGWNPQDEEPDDEEGERES